MKESCCDISSSLNSLSSEEVKLFTNSNNHFLACFSPSVQKFEVHNMENEEILIYKLCKTISFLPSASFLKPNHGMKAREEGMGKELSISFEDTSLSLSLNPLFLYASYVTLVGNKMNGSFEVLKVHLYDFLKTNFENGVFELALRDLDEKLVYSIFFIDYLLKCDILKDFLVQKTTSCVKLLNQYFGGIFLYSLTFKESTKSQQEVCKRNEIHKDISKFQLVQER
ncbi:hypothetical protein M9H77_07160 [Catharanthus roseus]|uniref:Uncharacterized protein n=1 Tax=Catharanthus roseus TaxID=4058 RepID=A0ACC0BU62_CATRO|nr:hypothetical protein M9H77_07160 [Catharanthus roseus]